MVTATKVNKKSVKITYTLKGEEHTDTFDKLIVAVGRRANTTDIASDDAGLKLDDRGRVDVDAQCKTNIPGVYAIGDAVKGPMLAHKGCLLYTSPSPRDLSTSRMPSSA